MDSQKEPNILDPQLMITELKKNISTLILIYTEIFNLTTKINILMSENKKLCSRYLFPCRPSRISNRTTQCN
jgi:hypothetical protein